MTVTDRVSALDGGGSKTVGAVADRAGSVWLTPSEAGCNPFDNPDWRAVFDSAISRITDIEPRARAVVLGVPGFGEVKANDRAALSAAKSKLGGRGHVINDVEMAFHGAFPQGQGVLLLAGTGSMAVARGNEGLARVGGWGDLFGDEGSAFWIGRSALSRASMELDGRNGATGFAQSLLAALKLGSADGPFALMAWAAGQRHIRSGIARIAGFVDARANDGDTVAVEILNQAAEALALHVRSAGQKTGLGTTPRWAHAGSVFNSKILAEMVNRKLGTPPVPARLPPLGGGLLLAARAAGWPCDDGFIDELAASLNQRKPERKKT